MCVIIIIMKHLYAFSLILCSLKGPKCMNVIHTGSVCMKMMCTNDVV